MTSPINHHYYGIYAISCENGSINGDPDSDNMPRQDNNGFGICTEVSIKRRIRDFLEKEDHLPIMVGIKNVPTKKEKEFLESNKSDAENNDINLINKNFIDVRMFGNVNGKTSIYGPVQFGILKTIDPIEIIYQTGTGPMRNKGEERTFTSKHYIEYGCYKGILSINKNRGIKSNMTQEDIDKMLDTLKKSHGDFSMSSSKGWLRVEFIYVFRSNDHIYNDREYQECIEIEKLREDPKSFKDYKITFNDSKIPDNSELYHKYESWK